MQARKRVAVAMTAMSIAVPGGGIGAAEAQGQSEVVQSTATTFWGGRSGTCFAGSASVTFSAAGPATGPYTGTFTDTDAYVRVSTPTVPSSNQLTLSIPFTINSGSTTITGTITDPAPYSGGAIFAVTSTAGTIVNANAATYTATIQHQGQHDKTVSGTAQFNASFEFSPQHILAAAPTATLLDFPSP